MRQEAQHGDVVQMLFVLQLFGLMWLAFVILLDEMLTQLDEGALQHLAQTTGLVMAFHLKTITLTPEEQVEAVPVDEHTDNVATRSQGDADYNDALDKLNRSLERLQPGMPNPGAVLQTLDQEWRAWRLAARERVVAAVACAETSGAQWMHPCSSI